MSGGAISEPSQAFSSGPDGAAAASAVMRA